MTQDDFNKVLLSAVDESLCLLGDSPKQAILFHLESTFKIKEESIPSNLAGFKNALEVIFGPGATYIEKAIAKRLQDRLGLEPEDSSDGDFLQYVKIAKSRILDTGEATVE